MHARTVSAAMLIACAAMACYAEPTRKISPPNDEDAGLTAAAPAAKPAGDDLDFIALRCVGVDPVHSLEIFSRQSPPLRVGDYLEYGNDVWVVDQLNLDHVTVDNAPHYHVTSVTRLDVTANLARALRPNPTHWLIDAEKRRFVLDPLKGVRPVAPKAESGE